MKLLKKVVVSITIIMTVLFSLVPPQIVHAEDNGDERVDGTTAGGYIAAMAEDLLSNHYDEMIYDYNCAYRIRAYHGKKAPEGTAYDTSMQPIGSTKDKYAVDCVGFVSMVVHHATGLGTYNDKYMTFFAKPDGTTSDATAVNSKGETVNCFDKIISSANAQRGDIVCWKKGYNVHVAICVGGGQIIDIVPKGIRRANITDFNVRTWGYPKVVRLNDDIVKIKNLRQVWDPSNIGSGDGPRWRR